MMNQEDIFKKIGQILNELGEQYQYLAQNPADLNELELELFLANANFLSDHVQIIKKLNNGTSRKVLPEHTETHEETPVQQLDILPVTEPVPFHVKPVHDQDIFRIDQEPSTFEFILSESSDADKFEFEEKSVDEIFDRPLSSEEEEIISRKQKLKEKEAFELQSPAPEDDEIGPEPFLVADNAEEFQLEEAVEPEPVIEPIHEPIPEPVIEPVPELQPQSFTPTSTVIPTATPAVTPAANPVENTPLAQTPVTEKPVGKPTLNDILAGNSGRSTQNGNSRMEITDLKQAINLNDKLRYIKDLFNGYNLAYAEAIDLVNKMPDFKTADTFLKNNYAVKNNWAAKQETADQFYELLNQRFPLK